MSDPLAPLRSATASLEQSREAWRHQIMEAHWLGYSNRAISAAAGVSFETVRTIIRSAPESRVSKPRSPLNVL